MKQHNFTHFFMGISFGIIVLIWIILMYWWLYPYKTSTQSQPYIVSSKVVKQGDVLKYEMDYCKYTNVMPLVQRQFIDGIIYSLPDSSAQLKRGCGKLTNSIRIPSSLPPGNYYLQASVSFKVNPIRTITNTYITEKFDVIKK